MLEWEKKLWSRGVRTIAGIDEVGKGPLAGPLVVSAAILDLGKIIEIEETILKYQDELPVQEIPKEQAQTTTKKRPKLEVPEHLKGNQYLKIKDSKKMTDRNRRLVREFLHDELIEYSIIEISNKEIDRLGISEAVQEAFYKSITSLFTKPEIVLTDFVRINKLTLEHQYNIPKGDDKSLSIAAASIMAKVHRDNIMIDVHKKYPQYFFEKHKGYGTKQHMEAIKKHGPCEIHRRSFEPIKSMVKRGKGK